MRVWTQITVSVYEIEFKFIPCPSPSSVSAPNGKIKIAFERGLIRKSKVDNISNIPEGKIAIIYESMGFL